MEIQSTAIEIHRSSTSGAGIKPGQTSLKILEPVQFTATITRNLGNPLLSLPNVDINLPMGIVKFHLHEEDVKALITIALSATKVTQVLSPDQQPSTDVKKDGGKGSPPLQRPGAVPDPAKLARMESVTEVVEVRVKASLHFISLDFATRRGPLFSAISSDVMASVGVYKEMVKVKASVDSLSVTDSSGEDKLKKIVSLAEDTDKASSLELKLDTRSERGSLDPLGEVKTRIAQVKLMLPPHFIQQLLEFVLALKEVNSELVINAAKLSKGGVQAITSKAWDKYLTIDVAAHAPVLILPVSDTSSQAFMVDLGSVSVRNMLLPLDEGAGVEAYGINLDSLKASRVLIDVEGDYKVLCERVLFQPFHIQLALERNLCSAWYSERPTLSLNCQMGEFKLLVGQEDLQQLVALGKNFGKSLSGVIEKGIVLKLHMYVYHIVP
ncbi:Vacuolar protein sorting-associated protein 13C, partial [Geodia barretti]